jgi:hypothetical protein
VWGVICLDQIAVSVISVGYLGSSNQIDARMYEPSALLFLWIAQSRTHIDPIWDRSPRMRKIFQDTMAVGGRTIKQWVGRGVWTPVKLSPSRSAPKYLTELENQVVQQIQREMTSSFLCIYVLSQWYWGTGRCNGPRDIGAVGVTGGIRYRLIHMSSGRVSPHVRLTSARKLEALGLAKKY